MDYNYLAELLFPDIKKTTDEVKKKYPDRKLPKDAKVTRVAPSPTGFVHLGTVFGALIDERLAHQSGGVFFVRIEDTDAKREVSGAAEFISTVFAEYGIYADEGVLPFGEKGSYGPYKQSERKEIYQIFAKDLVQKGVAYPCFCSENALSEMRNKQENSKENFGYYGKYAFCRDLTIEQIEKNLKEKLPFVLRFKSTGSLENKIKFTDIVKGSIELTENDIDHVLLKSDGIPTYHFAHAVDDYLMGTTHVVRGEEWLSTLPFHLQLFSSMGITPMKYLHTAHIMKNDENGKRKLSKRKDPEASMSYYSEKGFPVESVIEYLMTLLNSNYDEWRIANPDKKYTDFNFSVKKMGTSGSLYDMEKQIDVSKNTISRMKAEEVYDLSTKWAKRYNEKLYNSLIKDKEYAIKIFNIGRNTKKPRKDIACWSEIEKYLDFFYDELCQSTYSFDEISNVSKDNAIKILNNYIETYDENDNNNEWFNKITKIATDLNFAAKPKDFKNNPGMYQGHVGDVSMIIRIAITYRQNSPDMFDVMQILNKDKVMERIKAAINFLEK